jgi:hypothetical protein
MNPCLLIEVGKWKSMPIFSKVIECFDGIHRFWLFKLYDQQVNRPTKSEAL